MSVFASVLGLPLFSDAIETPEAAEMSTNPSYMKPGLHWSWRRCHFGFSGLWFQSHPPSCGSQTCRVWSCSGKKYSPAVWLACVWTSPRAAAGSGCPGHKTSDFWKTTHRTA